ncbi:MAG TPA: DUF4157 domain-containing protein [Roseiflexaceae bacterium]|nr:DUF4157 domain-containing protein [Roseiflexaceae bacterium]
MAPERTTETAERMALRRRTSDDTAAADSDHAHTTHPLVALQRHVGNAHIERMLAQRQGPEEQEDEIAAQHDPIQRQGPEEQEDEIAAQHDPIQRDAPARPEVGLEGGPVSNDLSGRINARRGGGAPLDDGTRSSMEHAFGTDLKDVRVHTDSEADSLNRSISARAFTTGSDIFFRKDASPGDHGLLAHELTHVVQQRSMSGGSGMKVGPAGDANEQEADSVASAVTSGTAQTAAAQREAEEQQAQRMLAQRESAEEEEEMPS